MTAPVTVRLDRLSPAVCGHCGRSDVGTYDAGYGGINSVPVCHPKANGRPDCYKLVTLFRHPMDCRCEEQYPMAGSRDSTVWA